MAGSPPVAYGGLCHGPPVVTGLSEMLIRKKKKGLDPVVHMIVPGRRALGETWSKVTITPNEDTGSYDVAREDVGAPADETPIFVPALGNISIEQADFLLEWSKEKAKERAKNPQRPHTRDLAKEINEAWHDYLQMKIESFQGKTVSGPGGWIQREGFRR